MAQSVYAEDIAAKLQYLCRQFRIPGEIVRYRRISNGHINETYYAAVRAGNEEKAYLIQRVNTYVFRNPVGVMHNIELITKHIMDKERPLERRRRLHFHHTADGKNYVILKNGEAVLPERTVTDWAEMGGAEFWRLCNFIESAVSFERAEGNAEVLTKAGMAFGRFNRLLGDFDAGQLVEPIPHFHDTAYRLKHFFAAAERDEFNRVKEVLPEIALIREHAALGSSLGAKIRTGELPLRVTHNDTKTNNVLFDRDTREPLVVIDLDTCMPGLICHDFGDSVRFAACAKAEGRSGGLQLDLPLFHAYADGYLSEMRGLLTDAEIRSLPEGAAVITLELAVRYLSDYLTGDKYFRPGRPGQNLDRARAQLSLFEDMMKHMEDMHAACE